MLGSGAMRRLATAVALAALLVVPGVQAQAQDTAEGGAYGASVSAIDNVFTPEIVRIEPGQTVEWTMDGRSPHTVQADDGSWDSGNLEPGAEFAHTFEEAGVYPLLLSLPRATRASGWPARWSSATRRSRAAARRGPIRSRPDRRARCGSPATPRRSRKPSTAPSPEGSS